MDHDRVRVLCDEYMRGRESRISERATENWGAYGTPDREDKDLAYAFLLGSTDYDQELNYVATGRGRKAPWLEVREDV
jgi:hypothetical protein